MWILPQNVRDELHTVFVTTPYFKILDYCARKRLQALDGHWGKNQVCRFPPDTNRHQIWLTILRGWDTTWLAVHDKCKQIIFRPTKRVTCNPGPPSGLSQKYTKMVSVHFYKISRFICCNSVTNGSIKIYLQYQPFWCFFSRQFRQ